MPSKYLYRILSEDEDPAKGISARDPNMTYATVSAHVNGLKKSPYVSTTATKEAIRAYAFFRMEVKNFRGEERRKGGAFTSKHCTVVEIDIEKLINDKGKVIQIFDLSKKEERDKYLTEDQREFAAKYGEVLVKGFIPAEYVKIINVNVMSEDEFVSKGYRNNKTIDYCIEY